MLKFYVYFSLVMLALSFWLQGCSGGDLARTNVNITGANTNDNTNTQDNTTGETECSLACEPAVSEGTVIGYIVTEVCNGVEVSAEEVSLPPVGCAVVGIGGVASVEETA